MISASDLNDYKCKYDPEGTDILRNKPTLIRIIQESSENQLSKKIFPYIGDGPEDRKKSGRGGANWHHKNDDPDEQEGRLIIFIVGGLSHTEICNV